MFFFVYKKTSNLARSYQLHQLQIRQVFQIILNNIARNNSITSLKKTVFQWPWKNVEKLFNENITQGDSSKMYLKLSEPTIDLNRNYVYWKKQTPPVTSLLKWYIPSSKRFRRTCLTCMLVIGTLWFLYLTCVEFKHQPLTESESNLRVSSIFVLFRKHSLNSSLLSWWFLLSNFVFMQIITNIFRRSTQAGSLKHPNTITMVCCMIGVSQLDWWMG